ncbi:MAG: glycoside hydrolase family 3 protein, partial [Candidatus Thorarchaeota archaeon]
MVNSRVLFKDSNFDINSRINDLMSRMTLDEKFKLMAGHRIFQTHSIKRLGIKPLKMTDGPLGISQLSSFFRKNTLFPGGINLAATWNKDLIEEYGKMIASEAKAISRMCLLAPGMNIIRTPLNGRNFEYFSEDPYLTKEIAIKFVIGVQSIGVAACIKHFVANNQETNRFTISAEIDERTYNEIYLRPFRQTIEEADPWTLMTSYNRVNGKYLFENIETLRNKVIDTWGFKGMIMTDWNATSQGKRRLKTPPEISTEDCIKSGLSLEMPSSYVYNLKRLKEAYQA